MTTITKTAEDMYRELSVLEEGGYVHTLRRKTPYKVDYIEQESRNSDSDRIGVYLRSPPSNNYPDGKQYRLLVDCDEGRFVMEEKRQDQDWRTHSTKFAGFRYRSPSHPEAGEKWEHSETLPHED